MDDTCGRRRRDRIAKDISLGIDGPVETMIKTLVNILTLYAFILPTMICTRCRTALMRSHSIAIEQPRSARGLAGSIVQRPTSFSTMTTKPPVTVPSARRSLTPPTRAFSTQIVSTISRNKHRPSILTPVRPTLTPTPQSPLGLPPTILTNPPSSSTRTFSTTSALFAPRNTYNNHHIKRKRKHGFLSRIKTRTGRMILKRRRAKGRINLAHC